MEIKDRIEQFIANWCPSGNDPKALVDFKYEFFQLLKKVASDSYGEGFVVSYDNSKKDFSDYWSDFLTNIEQDGK